MGELVTMADLEEQLAAEEYPLTRRYLIDEYGGYSLDTVGGEESIGTILERVEEDDVSDSTGVLFDIQAGVDGQGLESEDTTGRGGFTGSEGDGRV
jgi:hypothetical protein